MALRRSPTRHNLYLLSLHLESRPHLVYILLADSTVALGLLGLFDFAALRIGAHRDTSRVSHVGLAYDGSGHS
jgi:hypothetical protein